MKTNTPYLFLISLLTLLIVGGLVVYVAKQIEAKTEAVKIHYAKDIENKNIELGTTLKKEAAIIVEQEEVIKSAFLNQDEVISFITDAESLAGNLNLRFSVEKVEKGDEEAVGQTYKTQPVSFNVSVDGSFEQIKYFIEQLTRSKKVVQIKEFKIYKIGEIGNQYNARIIITSTILSI
jgi:Tfp pilus assembly protein PilO